MPTLQIVTTPDGRALEYDGQQAPLPALAVDSTVHAYQTPAGLWAGVQAAGKPRPVYAGSGGRKLGTIELAADTGAVLAWEKQRATERINAGYEAAMNALVAEYPETERESWGKQESEARAWLADSVTPTPFMDAVLLVRTSTTKTQLANRIITKSDALADATGQLTGKRHVLEAAIEAATTTAEVEAVTW